MKVYIVTQGEYSDYHIEGVFSTREKAQEYLDHIGSAWNAGIEEYNIDEETPRGVFLYNVKILDDGGKAVVEIMERDDRFTYRRKDVFGYHFTFITGWWFNVEAEDAKHAVKIASERLMQIKALPYMLPRIKKDDEAFRNGKWQAPVYDYYTKEIIKDE